MITPHFDFDYNGKPFSSHTPTIRTNGNIMRYELPDGLYAELHVVFFPEYDAVSWVIYYGNDGKNDSFTL